MPDPSPAARSAAPDPRCRRAPRAWRVVVVSLAFFIAGVAAQQLWYAAYLDGLKALERQNWAEAERLFREAKNAKNAPKPGRNVLFYGAAQDSCPTTIWPSPC